MSVAGAPRAPRLIVVCGPGGAGKTTLADRLARHLGVACLHKDDIKAALHDEGIVTSRSFQIFTTLVERQLSNGIDLIIEATWHDPADWGLLSRWRDAYGLDLVCVICTADRDERERRIRTRVRHPAHAEADRRQLGELDTVTDWSLLPGAHVVAATTGELDATARTVLARLS